MRIQSNVYTEVLIALRQILRATHVQSKRLARDTGLTTPQLVALQAIGAAGSMIAGELARTLNLSQATVTAVITRLEGRGLITRRRQESDKRRVVLGLTATGQSLLEQAPRPLQSLLEGRFASLEPWEQTQILAAVQRLANLMDAVDPEASPVLDIGNIGDAERG